MLSRVSRSTGLANGITHGVGFGLSIVGLIVLIVLSTRHGTAHYMVAFSIYGATRAVCLLWEHLTGGRGMLLLVGGVAYIIGRLFYAMKSTPHHHAIWHRFVMCGNAYHYFPIIFFVLPSGGYE